jgi:RNA polymerase sigma-70 factor, ECF subfamily
MIATSAIALRRWIVASETEVDAPAFASVYQEHADSVFRFCLSQLGDVATAEDVTADVFASAYAAFAASAPPDSALRPWLFRVARNAVIDHRRRARTRLRFLRSVRREQTAGGDVETVVQLRHDLRAVLAAVRRLKRRDRLLIGLRVAGGLSFAEIASITGMRENAARMATHRALRKVREIVEGESDV